MKGEWVFQDAYFSPEECDKILATTKDLPGMPGKAGGTIQEQVRRSSVKFVPKEHPSLQWVFDDLWKLVLVVNQKYFGFNINQLNFFQVAEYQAENQGEYKRHKDVFWLTKEPTHRKISCVVQLSDPGDYDGGQLELYGCQIPFPTNKVLNRGTAIFFPSFIDHAALPIKRGIRKSLAAWFMGPKWT